MKLEWGGAYEAWARNYTMKNHWRVRHVLDFEEALQECACSFARCLKLYGEKPGLTPAWFMGIFKRAVTNEFNRFCWRSTQRQAINVGMTDALELICENTADAPTNIISECWASASDELQAVLSALAGASSAMLSMLFIDDDMQRLNIRLRRFAGIKAKVDVVGELRSLLT